MKTKLKKGDKVLYYDLPATVLIEPDEFGQLLIWTGAEEIWCFEEEISIPSRAAKPAKEVR